MAFTDNCELYAAVSEDGVNAVARHIMQQRPSLFNYATAYIAAHPGLACAKVARTQDVDTYDNPLFSIEGPLPLLGVDAPPVGLNYSAQLVSAEIDFHPSNVFTLPSELNPPLPGQHLALRMRICVGLDCPAIDLIDGIQPWASSQHPVQPGPKSGQVGPSSIGAAGKGSPPIVPPTRKLMCFCLDAFAIGHVEVTELSGEPTLVGHVDTVDVVGVEPEGLHQAIDCYLRTTAELLLKEKLTFPVVKTFFVRSQLPDLAIGHGHARAQPAGAEQPGGPGQPVPGLRPNTGEFMSQIALAASAKAFGLMFQVVRDGLHLETSGNTSAGPFTAKWSVAVHLEDGRIRLTAEVTDLQVVWDPLDLTLCFDLPGVSVGGWCIIPDPFDGCWLSVPTIWIGGTICLDIDLSGLVSEITDLKANLVPKYYTDPARPPGVSDLTAEFLGHSNQWQVFLNPVWVSVDPIDVPATIESVIVNLLEDAIEAEFSWVPSWAWPYIWDRLGSLLDLFTSILGDIGDVAQSLESLLNNTIDLRGWLETALAHYLASKWPIIQFEDPHPILAGNPAHNPIPVKIPIRNLAAHINSAEMIVTADVGV